MYAKNDYVAHLLKVIDDIKHDQVINLFMICLNNDSYKVAIQLYLRFIKPQDMTSKIIDILISRVMDSLPYFEIKLFFILEHFDQLTIFQMNKLVNHFLEVLHRPSVKNNPMLS